MIAALLLFATMMPPQPQAPLPIKDGQVIPLWNGAAPGALGSEDADTPTLTVYLPRTMREGTPAVVVCPGGGYQNLASNHEGRQVANFLNSLGVAAFVLKYRLGPRYHHPIELGDAQRALRLVRSRAQEFGVLADRIGMMGFSAGGHLAATLATRHGEHVYERQDDADDSSARPFAAALIYPVITMKMPWTHAGSRRKLLGDSPSDADIERRSAELHVDDATPPVFMVHALDDEAVPVENSLRMMDALRAAKRPVEAHLLQEGGHGFGTGNPHTVAEHWLEWFPVWLSRVRATR